MIRKCFRMLAVLIFLTSFLAPTTAFGAPPSPEGEPVTPPVVDQLPTVREDKPIPYDYPNLLDYQRNREVQRLIEQGKYAEAAALAQTGTDRVMVVLVEFGEDVITWNEGDTWDPIGRADPSEYTGTVGDCSLIITETTTFTYTGPVHNEIPRPLGVNDASDDMIWTEDFSHEWFESFMFGNGVVISYTREDGSVVNEDFTGYSVRDFYNDMSGGVYTITGDIFGWVQVPHSSFYYDADQCPGARSGVSVQRGRLIGPDYADARTLVVHALQEVDKMYPDLDWTQYDADGDGVIDRLWIIHAGLGEEDSATLLNRTDYGEGAVWSHSWSVTPYTEIADGVSVGPYIIMPENGGVGVFAHEYGHNLGADDLYAYDGGETSAGFWTTMADDWTGWPVGFIPPAMDPWHLDNWGWLDPMVINDTSQVYEFTLGQASRFPGGDTYRAARIELEDQVFDLPIEPWSGDHYWWGGAEVLALSAMQTADPISIPDEGATLSFDMAYAIEDQWDFLWTMVSTDGFETFDIITNTNSVCTHDPAWIGQNYGLEGECGFTGANPSWPDPDTETFDLSPYAGQEIQIRFWYMTDWLSVEAGPFIDDIAIKSGDQVLFEDDAEGDDSKWVYTAPWMRSDGTYPVTHNFYLQWRNTNENGGYDMALGDPRWYFGPANTGLVMWYNNNLFQDNEVTYYLLEDPGFGPKGRMLVIDSHPEPYRDPAMVASGYDNEAGNVHHRSLMRDAPFTLVDTVDFTMTAGLVVTDTLFEGRPPVSAFHDSFGYYPGLEYVSVGPGSPAYRWLTSQWDASVTMPSKEFYGIKAPGYIGSLSNSVENELRFSCIPNIYGTVSCYWFGQNTGLGYDGGTGNPGDVFGQYGWHVQVLEEAEDHSWARVRVWNSLYDAEMNFDASTQEVRAGDVITYTFSVQNTGSPLNNMLTCIPLDPDQVEYVAGSASPGALLLSSCEAGEQALRAGGHELMALVEATTDPGAIAWAEGLVGTAEVLGPHEFAVKVKITAREITMDPVILSTQPAFKPMIVKAPEIKSNNVALYLPTLANLFTAGE